MPLIPAFAQGIHVGVFYKEKYIIAFLTGLVEFLLLASQQLFINQALLNRRLQIPYRPVGRMT
jgi:hypothetical protein